MFRRSVPSTSSGLPEKLLANHKEPRGDYVKGFLVLTLNKYVSSFPFKDGFGVYWRMYK